MTAFYKCDLTHVPDLKLNGKGNGKRQRFQASAYVIDTKGTMVRQSGIKMNRFQRNPVILKSHDHDMIVGRAAEYGFNEVGLWFSPEYSSTALAQDCKKQVEEGILRACSIGGRILRAFWTWDTEEEKPTEFSELTDDEKNLLAAGKIVGVILEIELWEISLCAVGANPEALVFEASAATFDVVSLQKEIEELDRAALAETKMEREETKMTSVSAGFPSSNPPQEDAMKRKAAELEQIDNALLTRKQEMAALEAAYAEANAKVLEANWSVRLASGKTVPALKELEIGLLRTLSPKQVEAYWLILDSREPLFSAERSSKPAESVPSPDEDATLSALLDIEKKFRGAK